MSSYIPTRLRRQVEEQANGYCAYCRSHQMLMGVTFEIDHIIPEIAGGETGLDNLCLSCPTCNRYKGTRQTAIDPEEGKEVSLFHPNQQDWEAHFSWSNDSSMVLGLTPIGRATVETLKFNRSVICQLRRYWVALRLHPPSESVSS